MLAKQHDEWAAHSDAMKITEQIKGEEREKKSHGCWSGSEGLWCWRTESKRIFWIVAISKPVEPECRR